MSGGELYDYQRRRYKRCNNFACIKIKKVGKYKTRTLEVQKLRPFYYTYCPECGMVLTEFIARATYTRKQSLSKEGKKTMTWSPFKW